MNNEDSQNHDDIPKGQGPADPVSEYSAGPGQAGDSNSGTLTLTRLKDAGAAGTIAPKSVKAGHGGQG